MVVVRVNLVTLTFIEVKAYEDVFTEFTLSTAIYDSTTLNWMLVGSLTQVIGAGKVAPYGNLPYTELFVYYPSGVT